MQRVKAFDWLRGLAVLVMLQTHSMMMLLPSLRTGAWFQFVNRVDGLVAPAFLLTAGFALALVMTRDASAAQARKSLRRIGEVLLVATAINCIWFPVTREPQWLLRMDILHCLALSLGLLWLLLQAVKHPAFYAGLAGLLFLVSPFSEGVTGPLSGLLNRSSGALFPLMPWVAYVMLGATCGLVTARQGPLNTWLAGLVLSGYALWFARPWLEPIYGAHDFWVTNISSCGHRWATVSTVALLLRWVEARLEGRPHRLTHSLEFFGLSSLSAYFIHEMLLFLPWPLSFEHHFRDRLDWAQMTAAVFALVALTAGVMGLLDSLRTRRARPA